MTIENITSVSMIGKLSSYNGDDFQSSTVDIKELLSGKASFREQAFCEELYLKAINFDIFVHREDENGNRATDKAGELFGRFYDIERCSEDEFDPLEVFDDVDQYTYEIYELGCSYHDGTLSDNIFAIDSFLIYPEYRKKSIGTAVIHILSDVLEAQFNMKAGCLVVIPKVIYDKEREPEPTEFQCERLKSRSEDFWVKLGFEMAKAPYWYFNLDMQMLVNGRLPGHANEERETYPKLVAESATVYEFPSGSDENKE
jgi:GNAT superfamily N-acetyltransferase